MNGAFLITAFDQKREILFSVDQFRNKWKSTANWPIVIVISGDKERDLMFNDDPLTRVVHLDDMVGQNFNNLVSTSIMRQINHGMIEISDLERTSPIDYIIHMHGDVLLLNEDGFVKQLGDFAQSLKVIAADPVGAQSNEYIHFDGYELMPQIFAVKHAFCKQTKFLYSMDISSGDLERRSTEWALIGNLRRSVFAISNKVAFSSHVYVVESGRQQWGEHKGWGGWCHYGNMLHYPKERREKLNKDALERRGINNY